MVAACVVSVVHRVLTFSSGDMELNAEKIGRFGSIARTGLMLASMGNHAKVANYNHTS
jgi:hypothetical protein